MTEQVSVRIRRQNPEEDGQGTFITYVVPRARTPTVLDALLYIYENVDSSLAFRYGCRNRDCGTCSLLVDGRPRLACLTKLKEGMTLEPLRGLPLLRDLAFDQRPFLGEVSRLALYIPPGWDDGPRLVLPPPEHRRLNACIECLCCMATCPDGGYGEDALAGPYTFVKLARFTSIPGILSIGQPRPMDLASIVVLNASSATVSSASRSFAMLFRLCSRTARQLRYLANTGGV